MTEVVITGVGLVSALGADTWTSWQRLLAGKTAIALRQPFVELPPLPLAMIGKRPARVSDLIRQGLALALADAQLQPPLADCGLVLGSSRGCQAHSEQLAQQFQSGLSLAAADWLQALPMYPSRLAAELLGCRGPVLAPMAACATGLWALAQGYQLLQSGTCDCVIVGAVEAPITPLTLAGFSRMGALAATGCYPFDQRREGFVLGEGMGVIVLETAAAAARRDVAVYGRILGFGLTNDAHHVSSPAPTGAIATLNQCLHRSQLAPEQIDAIHTHGTATQLNDQREADLVSACFPANTLVSATKGATGHTLGASGAMAAIFSALSLRHQVLPPCTGLSAPAFDLNFVRQAQAARLQHILCCSFGFGGQNALVALGRS